MSISDDANPYQPPVHPTEVPRPAVDLERLKGVAQTQRWVNRWALTEIATLVAVNIVPVLGSTRAGEMVVGLFVCFLTLAIFVGCIQLAYRTKGIGSAVVIGFVSWIPWANLIAALIVSAWATRMLKDAGFKTGIFGVSRKTLR